MPFSWVLARSWAHAEAGLLCSYFRTRGPSPRCSHVGYGTPEASALPALVFEASPHSDGVSGRHVGLPSWDLSPWPQTQLCPLLSRVTGHRDLAPDPPASGSPFSHWDHPTQPVRLQGEAHGRHQTRGDSGATREGGAGQAHEATQARGRGWVVSEGVEEAEPRKELVRGGVRWVSEPWNAACGTGSCRM